MFDWPNQKACWLNAWEPGIFKPGHERLQLITDFRIFKNSVPPDRNDLAYFNAKVAQLKQRGHIVGWAISATAAYPATFQDNRLGRRNFRDRFPQNCVNIEDLNSLCRYRGARESGHWDVDIEDRDTSIYMYFEISKLMKEVPAPLYFLDNCPNHPSVGVAPTWKQTCDYLARIARYANRVLKARVVFNISMWLTDLTDEEVQYLIASIKGNAICLEQPLQQKVRDNPELLHLHTKRFLQFLDAGIAFVLVHNFMDGIDSDEEKMRTLHNFVETFRQPQHRIYLTPDLRKEIPAWLL